VDTITYSTTATVETYVTKTWTTSKASGTATSSPSQVTSNAAVRTGTGAGFGSGFMGLVVALVGAAFVSLILMTMMNSC
jgi:hypothetical protein